MHELTLSCVCSTETKRQLPGVAYYFNSYFLKQQPEGVHRNTLIGTFQNPILEDMKQIVCVSADQEIHLVFPEIPM
jgi:hypothetical protein